MRVHILAKELSVPSKIIIKKCNDEGIDTVKNHMSTLSAGLHATIREWFSEGSHSTTIETADRVDLKKARVKKTQIKSASSKSISSQTASATAIAEAPAETVTIEEIESVSPDQQQASSIVAEPSDSTLELETLPVKKTPSKIATTQRTKPIKKVKKDIAAESKQPSKKTSAAPDASVTPAGPQNVPTATKLKGPRVVRYEAPDYSKLSGPKAPAPRVKPPDSVETKPARTPTSPVKKEVQETGKRKTKLNTRRAAGRLAEVGEKLAEWRNLDLVERKERLAGATGRKIHRRQAIQSQNEFGKSSTSAPTTKAVVHEPVRIKEFCAETGINFMQLFKVLKNEHGILANINMNIQTETAILLALHYGIELEVIPAKTALDIIEEEFAQRERKNLQSRPPVVAILGHVDHGKTSLLDAIRKTQVAAGEDGGITQHISSYHVETNHGAVTFLDTPGHEAFTAMRARGAQITDVVVLVVAADDGIMPQTIEAIRHAQSAKVPVVVALNKIDLGDQNKLKIYGQLAEHNLTPSGDWGGETDVIPTSATTQQGISELVEHLADLSSLLELKSDPTLPAMGTVIEAETKPGVGSVIHLLVQEGTLRVGDFAVCGNAFGKVRALKSDQGKNKREAGPSIPIEIWGLDEVPSSGDKLFVVDNLQRAKTIATEIKQLRIEASRMQSRKVSTLEEMFKQRDSQEVPELNIIIKADVDGSIAALNQSLADFPSEEVRLSIRHEAVGPVNDSDVLLSATSKGIIVAYRVDIPTSVRRMAEQHGVDIRPYRVIYNVVDDIRKALSGLLAPEERVETRGKAEIRQVFRITKAGMVAGSFVTEGLIDRNNLAKVVRDGVVVRENCKFASLKHFKDDVKEVRQGLECGIRLDGFDDVHVGDIIETYEIVKIARTL